MHRPGSRSREPCALAVFIVSPSFGLSGRRWQVAKPGPVKIYGVPPARAWWPAVGPPLERGVSVVIGQVSKIAPQKQAVHNFQLSSLAALWMFLKRRQRASCARDFFTGQSETCLLQGIPPATPSLPNVSLIVPRLRLRYLSQQMDRQRGRLHQLEA